MQRTNYFNGELVSLEDLDASQTGMIKGVKDTRAQVIGGGIVSGLTLTGGTTTIDVATGTAFDYGGEFIRISDSLTYNGANIPTGRLAIPVSVGTFYVCINYAEYTNRPKLDPSSVAHSSRTLESYQITLQSSPVPPTNGLILGKVVASGSTTTVTQYTDSAIQALGYSNILALNTEVQTARGSLSSLGSRLDVSTNADGTLKSSIAGDGLGLTSNILKVNTDGVTIEINSDDLRVKDLGISASKIASGTITDTQISSSAGIAISKVNTDPLLEVGDTKWRMCATVVAGARWLLMDGKTIGDASSGATALASPDAYNLFCFLWNNVSDTYAPVSGGRGATADADFAGHRKITIPSMAGLVAVGFNGADTNFNAIGKNGGENTHTLIASEMPSHKHTVPQRTVAGGSGSGLLVLGPDATTTCDTSTVGSDGAHNNLQPYRTGYYFIRY